ncbi:hypothetical protein ACWD4J_03010 [Streptomyces sp. NPDC002577]
MPVSLRGRRALQVTLGIALLAAIGAPASADDTRDLSRETLAADDGWIPSLHGPIDSAAKADHDVARGAGAGRIR